MCRLLLAGLEAEARALGCPTTSDLRVAAQATVAPQDLQGPEAAPGCGGPGSSGPGPAGGDALAGRLVAGLTVWRASPGGRRAGGEGSARWSMGCEAGQDKVRAGHVEPK
jgi:hypothetical protein